MFPQGILPDDPIERVNAALIQAAESPQCYWEASQPFFDFILAVGGKSKIVEVARSLPASYEQSVDVKAKAEEILKMTWPLRSGPGMTKEKIEGIIKQAKVGTSKRKMHPSNFYLGVKVCVDGMNRSTFGF